MDLIWRKQNGQELDMEPRIHIISKFIETEIERLKIIKPDGISIKPEAEKLDELFRWALEEVW